MLGKERCKALKEIRQKIAVENDIEFVVSECTYQGECTGTCPKCEEELRYLERELEKRKRIGKAAVIVGISLGVIGGLAVAAEEPIQNIMLDKMNDFMESISPGGIIGPTNFDMRNEWNEGNEGI